MITAVMTSWTFFEAVKARQAAAICEDGLDHQRNLELLMRNAVEMAISRCFCRPK